MASDMGLRDLDDFTRSKLRVQANPWFSKDLNDEGRAGYRTALQERHQADLARIAERAAGEKADREKRQAALKALKDEQAGRKKAQDDVKKEEMKIAKEKADIEKQEKRVQAMEEKVLKQARQKEEAIEKAKRKAQQQASQAEERARKIAEREENIRRQVEERNARVAAQAEIAEATKKAYEERQRELAVETEARNKTREARAADVRKEMAVKLEKEKAERAERAEQAELEQRLRQLRLDKQNPTQPSRISASHPSPMRDHNPRDATARTHAGQGPSSATLTASSLSLLPSSESTATEDPRLSAAINARLMQLIERNKAALQKEKEASLAAVQGISPMLDVHERPPVASSSRRTQRQMEPALF